MSVGVYKPGQGYWVRVLTACFAGALVLSGAAWAWNQAATYEPPTPTYRLSLAAVQGELKPGVQVDLYQPGITESQGDELIGTATVDSFNTGDARTGTAILSNVRMQGSNIVQSSRKVVNEDIVGQASPFSAEVLTGGVVGIAAFDRIYVQGAIAGTILLVGTVLIYLFVAMKRQTVNFLIATDGEMKKVNWSTRKEVQGSTMVVVIASFLLAMLIFVIDYGFGAFFKLIGVLES